MTSKQAIEQGLREGLKRCGTSKTDINKILNGVKVEIKEKKMKFHLYVRDYKGEMKKIKSFKTEEKAINYFHKNFNGFYGKIEESI